MRTLPGEKYKTDYSRFEKIGETSSSEEEERSPRTIPEPTQGGKGGLGAAVMSVLAAGTEQDLSRRCVDCGLFTGNFCDGIADNCYANERLPEQGWVPGQRTPLCTTCDRTRGRCYFCRVETGLRGVCYFEGHKCSHCQVELGLPQQVAGGLPPELDPRPPLLERNQGDRGGGRNAHKARQSKWAGSIGEKTIPVQSNGDCGAPGTRRAASPPGTQHLQRPHAPRAVSLAPWTESPGGAMSAPCLE